MPTYTAPTRDARFILNEVLELASYGNLPGFEMATPDVTDAIIDGGGKFCSEVLAPINRIGDEVGCTRHEDGSVTTPPGFKEAFDQFVEAGWGTLSAPEEFGGQGMPHTIGFVMEEFISTANQAFGMYPGLTTGAISALIAKGSDEQKQKYLPKMIAGEWLGTMNLTEPHCGTDLGMIRTKAEPQADGSYKITGTKIFISAGDHDLAENVIHLVLAKAPGGGEGTKGISLFIVPKFLVNEDGSLGERNGVSVGALEHKMGIHANATCVMNYDGAKGWLLGDLHKGMRAMFTMMNEARIGVGLQGYAGAVPAYQNAVAYAKDRLQGRSVTGAKNPSGPADPLIVHPDIRRSLMDQKSFLEGARALTLWGAHLVDRSNLGNDAGAEGLISLMTPVIKGFLTDKGFEATVLAQQVFGGHGYVEEWGMSQFVRDARITMIYEGANGVQALDLVGRKLAQDGGKHVMAFFEMIKTFCKDNAENQAIAADFIAPLKAASKDLQSAAMFFMERGMTNPNDALSGSYDFMHLFGHVTLGFMWARMAVAAQAGLDAGTGDAEFLKTKLATGRYYMKRQLPMTATHLARIQSGAETVMELDQEAF